MSLDTQLFYLLNNLAGQSQLLDGVIVFLASYLAYVLIIAFIAFVLFSQYQRREKLQILFVAGVSTLIARFGVAELIRLFYQRPRPFSVLDNVQQLLTSNEWSFPSGHATFFFALATVVYLHNKKWGIGFFIATIFMTTSRVVAGIHYPSDIVGGAIIGIAVAYTIFYITQRYISTTHTKLVG
ncbi:MAG: Bacitracin transport permease protein BCRC [Parcubacteria group bacterium Gr01-1014_91]|nr:MAG: Bacitracin transport permease protein BCRC [Parcubacteria group bacterium Gr01-1014_91]